MKKGFTLIELLAVVSMLAILLLIGTISVTKIIKDNQKKLYDEQINSFIESAKTWSYAHTTDMPALGSSIKLTLADLTNEHFIKEGIVNPLTNEAFSTDDYICIFNFNSKYVYEYEGEC